MQNNFGRHPYIINGYSIACISSSLLSILFSSFFLYSVKKTRREKKWEKEKRKERKCPFTLHRVSLLQTIALYPSPFRSISSMLPLPWRLLDLFFFSLSLSASLLCSHSRWYSPLLTTTIRYARIIISTFYTYTFFSSSHLTTRFAVHSYWCFSFLLLFLKIFFPFLSIRKENNA